MRIGDVARIETRMVAAPSSRVGRNRHHCATSANDNISCNCMMDMGWDMDKKVAGLAGALAVSALSPGQASTPAQPTSRAQASAELLQPIPNAIEELKAADATARENAANRPADPRVQLAQYWGNGYYYHHHHHHHNNYWGRPGYYYPHHHHHHHNWYRSHHHHHWGW